MAGGCVTVRQQDRRGRREDIGAFALAIAASLVVCFQLACADVPAAAVDPPPNIALAAQSMRTDLDRQAVGARRRAVNSRQHLEVGAFSRTMELVA
jgi:hypothetical protein